MPKSRKSDRRRASSEVKDVELNSSSDKFSKPNNHIQPKTRNQEKLIDSILKSEIVVANGPAGVGKTYIVGSMASKFLMGGEVEKIVLTRANVGVGKSIGALPGTIEDKMTPLLLPILSVLRRRMGDGVYSYNMSKKKIEMLPLEYVRGNSYKDTFLIIDEAQNLTQEEVKALVTRYESGRILFLGDPFQNDLKGQTGLEWLIEFAKRHNLDYPVVTFELDDIVRSELVKKFLIALYSESGKLKESKEEALPSLLKG